MGKNAKFLMASLVVSLLQVTPLWAAPDAGSAPTKAVSGTAVTKAPAKPAQQRNRSNTPIHVKSSELFADNNAKTATFIGKVVARQDDVTIYCDKMIVYYGENSDEVDKIEAIGSVRILQTNRVGTGGHGLYESKIGKITLTIQPRVTQDRDTVTGQVIVYYLDEDRSHVTSGDSNRVEAVIYPKQKEKKPDARKKP